ncbi:DUF1993 domain-containing protein [Pseudomonas sp. K2I15]|uniref:DUF1993 domain-containing protein n=1 Tax=unclassified Pseudomonas TaxID=196821 RepID=UPI000B4D8F54|nr:DUF1993 domain-containing protein [Pseudomonas sp. K2I15]OWP73343.1 hypothetical protein CEC48_02625 [Pseudomonas sp. K2I15]
MSIYAITVPCFAQMLRSLKGLLSKGESHAHELGYDPQNLLNARLAPDMHPLATQIRFACTQAQEAIQRLTHQPLPALSTPTTLDEARGLIEQTLQTLATADRTLIDASSGRPVAIELPDGIIFDMTAHEYAVNWALPQFYFHLMTAYNILRHNGVPLGKADYVPHMFAFMRAQ